MRRCASLAVLATVVAGSAEAASCRAYPGSALPVVKAGVEALRLVEREAADRLQGLDTRPWEWLVGEARSTVDKIADDAALQEEDALKRCRNYIRPIRRECRAAALSFVTVLERQAADDNAKDARRAYVEAIRPCEEWTGLRPLSTAFRSTD